MGMGGCNHLYILCLLFVFLLGFSVTVATAELIADDKQALLDFMNQLPHLHGLNWRESSTVCGGNWTGVTCNAAQTRVIAVRLPAVGFSGQIPPDTLSRLSALQLLSLRSNKISGPFPSDFANLKNLSMLYLQSNKFSGPLPTGVFSVWKNLTVLDLSNNGFNGSIPSSISSLIQLVSLNLANNSLSGEIIPELGGLPSLQQLDLSYNNLTGPLPKSLERFPDSSFVGNHVGGSVVALPPLPSQASSHKLRRNNNELGNKWLEVIVICCSVLGILAFGCLLVAFCSRRRRELEEEERGGFTGKFPKSPGRRGGRRTTQGSGTGTGTGVEKTGLVFFEGGGCNYAFDLEDLLRASAEVLGKGTFGMSYKAILEDANVVVVKRLKDVRAGKKEFEQQMEVIGRVRHENVVALRAYYYSKDEKLMVTDYCGLGSASALLHGNRGEADRVPLDWETRLRIAIGAARGIAHIHQCNSGKLVHGNVRSSNIFISMSSSSVGCVSDFGLAQIMSPVGHPISRAAGYRAPEVSDTRKASQSADVYSFGVFLLELLTGKSPVHAGRGGSGDELVHLVRWVHSVVREEWTGEVFDRELMRYPNIEEEMVELLQVAMACVVRVADQRPTMTDVIRMIQGVKTHTLNSSDSAGAGAGALV